MSLHTHILTRSCILPPFSFVGCKCKSYFSRLFIISIHLFHNRLSMQTPESEYIFFASIRYYFFPCTYFSQRIHNQSIYLIIHFFMPLCSVSSNLFISRRFPSCVPDYIFVINLSVFLYVFACTTSNYDADIKTGTHVCKFFLK